MPGFWKNNRNRDAEDFDERLAPGIKRLMSNIDDARTRLINHPVYAMINSEARLHVFMSYHIWAVWDFMCLLKALQRGLSCVDVPWYPKGDPKLRRLVNEIVVAEETDENGKGGYNAHFELYLESMQQCGADASNVDKFVDALKSGGGFDEAMKAANLPEGARAFTTDTVEICQSEMLPMIAAAFTFGREDVVPLMFTHILDQVNKCDLKKYDRFIYYLDRHIAVDADEHGPMAFEMVDLICGGDEAKWAAAETAARRHIENRCKLWDACVDAIKAMDAQSGGVQTVGQVDVTVASDTAIKPKRLSRVPSSGSGCASPNAKAGSHAGTPTAKRARKRTWRRPLAGLLNARRAPRTKAMGKSKGHVMLSEGGTPEERAASLSGRALGRSLSGRSLSEKSDKGDM